MIYLIGLAGIVLLALVGAVGFEHQRVVAANTRADAAELKVRQAEERATSLALLWSAQVDKTEAETRKAKEEANAEIASLNAKIAKLPSRVVVFDTATASLFTDIAATANATQPAAVSEPAPDPVPATAAYDEREVTQWIADAGKAYRDARDKWQACVNFYLNLQKEQ